MIWYLIKFEVALMVLMCLTLIILDKYASKENQLSKNKIKVYILCVVGLIYLIKCV
ncbi:MULTISPECIES: hypothetical protein [unclassified Campylobacter]|uniref:hypothetical protein n=1 Tax=unclassified Campylobacter TaxID=2593542 RepID=UPI001EFA3800|nr:hypothetical protein [Campylobacter sp. RM12651]MBZ7976741.1 hypothetical protein [Campylobacter sp. RM12637]ULO02891.1 hypothetical protein AVBRAN_0421 [Campylobacter sp. RM12651]